MQRTIATLALFTATAFAQGLSPEQKRADFQHIVGNINHWYAPLDWKKQLYNVDALDLKTWSDRAAQTQTDLEYYELLVEYIAQFRDSHAFYGLPANFVARLGITLDIFDGKVLIETIDRNVLPARDYPFAVGDEIISVDGELADELVRKYTRYTAQGNERATRRMAAARISVRPQARMPHAAEVGETASVVIRLASGAEETYQLRWVKTGTPMRTGAVQMSAAAAKRRTAAVAHHYMAELEQLEHSAALPEDYEYGVLSYGARNPVFLGGLGSGFTRRLGGNPADFFYSGVFRHDGLNIGFLRIPNYGPPSIPGALQELDREIAWMQANTDGLVIDQMRNTGGNLCFGESVMQRLATDTFHITGFELRAFYARVMAYYNSMINAKASGASPEVIERWESLYNAMAEANRLNRGVTAPIGICTPLMYRNPATDVDGNRTNYTKPIMMMIDEFSTSTGDSVPSMFQESRRGLLIGMRSNGAGGNNISVPTGAWSEGTIGVTIGVQVKNTPVSIEGYPTTGRLENVGVHPDVVVDYMTRDNLMQNGAPFVREFLAKAAEYIRSRQ